MFIHKLSLLDVKVGVWCAVSAAKIIAPPPLPPRFFGDRVFTQISYTFIFWTCEKFQEKLSLLTIQGKQLCVLFVFFSCQNNKQGIWPCSSDLKPCSRFFYLWVMLKDEVSTNNPCTKEELKKSVRNVEPSVSAAEYRGAMNRLYMTHVCGSKENFFSTFYMYTLAWLE